jgi:hypothetical protein
MPSRFIPFTAVLTALVVAGLLLLPGDGWALVGPKRQFRFTA